MPTRRQPWLVGMAILFAVAVLAWGVHRMRQRPNADDGAVVTVHAPSPTATIPIVAEVTEPRLAPPRAPPLPDTMAAAPDAFVGDWQAEDGQRLTITMQDHDRYHVILGEERYDGVLKDGRLHFPRGIDGEWLQAARQSPCLYIGTGVRFCRR